MGHFSHCAYTYLHNFKLESLEELPWRQSMYWLKQVKPQKPGPSPWHSTNLWGKQIRTSSLGMSHWNFQSHPRTSFRINKWRYNKYDTHKSTIKKIRSELRTWMRFYIKKGNQLKQSSLNTQPAPFPRPLKNCGGSKSACPVWIRPTDNFESYPRTSFSINKRWSGKCEQMGQQSTT